MPIRASYTVSACTVPATVRWLTAIDQNDKVLKVCAILSVVAGVHRLDERVGVIAMAVPCDDTLTR